MSPFPLTRGRGIKGDGVMKIKWGEGIKKLCLTPYSRLA